MGSQVHRLVILSFGCCFAATMVCQLFASQDADEDAIRDAWSEEYLKLAKETRITSITNAGDITLVSSPLMRWRNTVRADGSTSGDFFVWVRNKQPVAVGTFFSYIPSTSLDRSKRRVAMAFHALIPEDLKISVDKIERVMYGSHLQQVEYAIPGNEVAESASKRLFQMRSMAKLCEAETQLNGQSEPLRLLPQPLLVMGEENGKKSLETDPGKESSLFAFVTGTDPEILVLIQAVPEADGKKSYWKVTPARFTDLPFEVKFDSKSIWKSEGTISIAPFISVHGLLEKPLDPRK